MSCDVSTSLLCKDTFWPLEILSSTPIFPIWSSRHFCTATHLIILLKILPSVWRYQWMHKIHLQAKTQWCSLKNLSGSTSFAFWSNLVICTATIFFLALVTPSFLLLVALPTKLLSPGDWAHWRFWNACSKPFFFLPKTGVLQNLHYLPSVFAKLTLPPSPPSKETLIWRFCPLQELPKCIWLSVEHLVCTVCFGMSSLFALWTCSYDPTIMSPDLLATPTLVQFFASRNQAL